jgi:RNA polymerase sigma-70 factor (ECF subfamily)
MDVILRLREQDAVEEFLSNPSEGSFCELFANVGPRIMRYFRTQGCDRELAEDLTQEVMLIVYRRGETVRDKRLFRPWLYKVAKNSLLQHVRRNGRQVETVQLDVLIQDRGKLECDPLSHSQFLEWMVWLEPDRQRA